LGNITSGKAKFAAKNAAAYKPNLQINGKEGKGKKRNDSGIAFKQAWSASRPSEPSEEICTLKINE